MLEQFKDLKKKHPDAVLLFRCGDFYEAYEEDAEACAKILGITLTSRAGEEDKPYKMAGFPWTALDTYLPKLIRAGRRCAICDQIEQPKKKPTQVKPKETKDMEKPSQLMNIEVGRITPSPRNQRKTFDEGALDELAQNIKVQGLLQPITVRPVAEDSYEIVCGERRYRAVKKIAESDTATIACIVKEMTDDEAFDAMITENLQRKDVDPIEEAFAFSELTKNGTSVDEIAARFGKSKRFVQERIKLNTLIEPLKALTTSGRLPIAGAFMLAKMDAETQERYNSSIPEFKETIELKEVSNWIAREFMKLENAEFLEYDDEDETKPPTEDWNTGQFERCATCCMNTANTQCLFYSMKGDHQCTDRKCYEKKTAAYLMREIDKYSGKITTEGTIPQVGNMVIVDEGEQNYGYENVKRIRKALLDAIKESGYMVVKPDYFDGQCKYYDEDDRLPKLLEQGKVMECITLGTPWCLEVEVRYYYIKGVLKEDKEEQHIDPIAQEVSILRAKYKDTLDKMNSKANEELRKWTSEKEYEKRRGPLDKKEMRAFWSVVISLAGGDFLRGNVGCTEYYDQEKILDYIDNNLTEDNMAMWQRAFINHYIGEHAAYNKLAQRVMRDCFKLAYPQDYEELAKKHANQFERRTDKIKTRLEELGYNVLGKKLQ